MKQSIRNKMMFFIGVPTVAIYIGVMVWILMFSKRQAHRFHHQEMADKAETAADRFNDYISKASRMGEITAGFISRVPDLSDDQAFGIVSDLVEENQRIYGAALAFEPGTLKPENELFCPYAYRANGKVVSKNINRDVYDWYGDEKWQWWHQPKKTGEGSWTEPYFDQGAGNVLMMTYSAPFRKDDEFYGVATIDIDVEALHGEVGRKIVGRREFYVLSADGQFVYSPHPKEMMNQSVFELLKDRGKEEIVSDVKDMLAGKSGVITLENLFEKERYMYAFAPIPSTGWTFVAYMPESEALAEWRQRMLYVVSAFVGALVLILAAIFLVSRRLTKPIEKLRDTVLQVADGDLDARVDGSFSNDEIGDLANNFNRMTADLKGQVLKLASEEAHREKAEEENRAKSDFLSHMSHELRTPLNGILGYAQILQRDAELPSGQRASVDAIVNCGDHLLSLINDVLDLSKIEAGHAEVDLAPCDLHKLMTGVGDIVGQRARGKKIGFDIEVSPEVPQGIVSDAAKIRQILVNLLGNAVKFTAEGAVLLKVSESPKGMLRFAIIDSGVGMTAEEIEGIFDPFKQVEAGKAAGGTGLGLAITQRLTKILQGKVEVSSEPGKGSTFTVTIPLEEAPIGDLSKLEVEEDWNQTATKLAPGQEVSVLVADDREANRDILDQLLTTAGFETLIADDGDVAVEMAKEHHVNIVLMDVRMPRMNGIEAVKMIRNNEGTKNLKVIAVTASVFPEFREKARAAGFDDFLGKPFRVGELMHILEKHLDVQFERDDAMVNISEGEDEESGAEEADWSGVSDEILEKLEAALKIRNLTSIKDVAAELSGDAEYTSLGAEVLKLATAFDFAGLTALVERLK